MSLDQWLNDADEAAAAVAREHPAPEVPADRDVAELVDRAGVVDRFLSDVEEAIKQVAVAGLAYPDPELPDELAVLARRSKRLGVATATRHLLRLRAVLLALFDAEDPAARHDLSVRAWDETQRLISWLRLFRVEHDFLTVQARITASSGTGPTEARPSRYPSRSISVFPLGFELGWGGKAALWCRGVDGSEEVLLFDELAEHDVGNPMGGRAISRLFQDGVVLGELLNSVLRFTDHPVVDRDGLLLFRPAFQARPTRHAVASDFTPPALSEIPLGPLGQPDFTWRGRFGRLPVGIRRDGQRLSIRTHAGSPAEVHVSPLLRVNLTKLLMREQRGEVEAELVARIKDKQLHPLGLRTDFDGRHFPAVDPRAYRLHREVLFQRAQDDPLGSDTLYGLWLRVAAATLGGASHDALTALRAAVAGLELNGIEDHYRAGLIRWVLGMSEVPDGLEALLRKALRLGALPAGAEVDLDDLALVLELPRDEVSPADLRLLDGGILYAAVWLALVNERVDPLIDDLLTLYQNRFAGELKSPTPSDVCARALLVSIAGGGAEVEQELEVLDLDDDLDGGYHSDAARQFLDAHLQAWSRKGGRRGKRKPLPEPLDLFRLADTRAILTAGPRRGTILESLELPTGQLRALLVDRLFPWMVEKRTIPHVAPRRDAADALWLASLSRVREHFFE